MTSLKCKTRKNTATSQDIIKLLTKPRREKDIRNHEENTTRDKQSTDPITKRRYKHKAHSKATGIHCTIKINIATNNRNATKSEKKERTKLELLRIGTCGLLQADIPLHSYILSEFALGLDNIAHFYKLESTPEEKRLLEAIHRQDLFPENITPYLKQASIAFLMRFKTENSVKGITVTSSGFYGPQGRELRIPTYTQNLNEALEKFKEEESRFVNFEMESSALYALGGALGHSCATICLGIANRPLKKFSSDYSEHMQKLIAHALEKI